jgi:hypothetical protein
MPGTYTPLNEWCDENSHRQFPLTDDATGKDQTDTYSIPQAFMVDMILAVPIAYNTTKFYVKSLVVRRLFIDIEIGYDDGAALTVGWARNIPHDSARNAVYSISPVVQDTEKDFEMLTGAVVIGDASEIVEIPGVFSFDPADSYIHAGVVTVGLACVQSLQVGAAVLTGNLVLKEGENVRLEVDALTNTITVIASLNDDDGTFIGSDADIIEALTNEYGAPITSINGQPPDGDGNFQVVGADCTSVSRGNHNITIKNPCAEPCCDKSLLTDVYAVLSQLNIRYAVLESYYQNMGLTVNQMQARIVGLERI